MYRRRISLFVAAALVLGVTMVGESLHQPFDADPLVSSALQRGAPDMFSPASACISCHNGLVAPSGEDISFGADWRASMMGNAARDPYWQAAVRREVTDHPLAREEIEHECSTCHMPMAHFQLQANGAHGEVSSFLPIGQSSRPAAVEAADGVSCTVCHQITDERFGTRESFAGGFVVDTVTSMGQRSVYGPYPADPGLSSVMHSASGFRQQESIHIQESEMCATCHTLFTKSLGADGEVVGELPEQVPYLEWKHSAYRIERSCQSCHMPVVDDSTAISAVLGKPRANVSRHAFRGGNFFMLRMLNRFRAALGVTALPRELDTAVRGTIENLQSSAADVSIESAEVVGSRLEVALAVENKAGHKLPSAYPSRRTWIHFTVHDRSGRLLFESGAIQPSGAIAGNDNDTDGERYEPHYTFVTESNQVQVYETIMAEPGGDLTTGLLTAVSYVKDNRLLPRGFDKSTASQDVAVHGLAAADDDFVGGGDRLRYLVDLDEAEGPYRVRAELWYQTIGFRWAKNLEKYEAPETERFVALYESMSDVSALVLADAEVTAR